jgi:uroporphyrinogen decarboxylase
MGIDLTGQEGTILICDHRCTLNVKPEDYLYYLELKEAMHAIAQ